jgi:hypothetical protein
MPLYEDKPTGIPDWTPTRLIVADHGTGGVVYLWLGWSGPLSPQCRRGLEVFYDQIILPQILSEYRRQPAVKKANNNATRNQVNLTKMKWGLARFISKFTDFYTIRLISSLCIFLSYAGTIKPMILAAWFFVIFGILWDIADVVFKFFYLIPHVKHVKKI